MTTLVKLAAITATSALALISSAGWAQDSQGVEDGPAAASDEASGGDIVVTGLRGRPRTVTDSPVPVDVFNTEAIERNGGLTDTLDILQTLIPSYSVSRSANTTANTFVRAPSLRGLSADKTLLLLNGRRRHKSGSVSVGGAGSQAADSAVIPAIALQSIEVLRDGAAAQYGSDAIAGVINYTLKDASEGGTLAVQAGQFYEGDGESIEVAGNIGLPLTDSGFLNLSAEFSDDNNTVRSRTFTSTAWDPFTAYDTDAAFRSAVDAAGLDLNDPLEQVGQPKSQAIRTVANAGIDLNDNDQLYGFGNYSWSKGDAFGTYRVPGGGHQVMDNPIRLDDGSIWRFKDMYPLGLQSFFSGEVTDWSVTGGWRTQREFGNGHEFTADLAARYGYSNIAYSITDSVNPSMGPDSPLYFRASDYTSDELGLNADFTYSIPVEAFAGPLEFAFGAEFRREGFEIGAGEPASYTGGTWSVADPFDFCTDEATIGSRTLRPGAPTDMGINCALASDPVYKILQPGSNGVTGLSPDVANLYTTESYSLYGEVTVDLLEGLFLDLATRYEDYYQTFGDKLVWKAAARYYVTDWAAIRGSLGTGFRAPSAGTINMTQTQINTVGGVPLNSGLYPATNPVSLYLGAVPLQPETSKNYSVGITLTPLDGFSLTIDAYRIDLKDQIYATTQILVTPAIEAAMIAAGIEGASSIDQVNFFQNAFDSRTQGVDVVASYRAFWFGDTPTTLTAAFNANSYKIQQVNIAGVNFNAVSRYNFANNAPAWRANFTANHDFGPVQATVRGNVFGPYSRQTTAAGNAIQEFSTQAVVDVELTAPLGDNYQLTIGARNLFDHYPATNQIDDTNGRTYTDGPVSWQGGYYFARMAYTF